MLIKFYGPFDERIGKSLVEFRVDGEITLTEFVKRLIERFPFFRDYMKDEKDFDILNSVFFVARKGILLRSDDIVMDDDKLEIVAALGGDNSCASGY